jgi:hypothetical protein
MKHYACLFACGCLLGGAALPAHGGDELAKQLARMARLDPDSPVVLEAQLERVRTLIKADDGSACEPRLAAAAAALTAAQDVPALSVLLPLGPARMASIEYELHRARARCMTDAAGSSKELQEAVAAAQRSVDLYRDGLDYPSMAIMQYNVAATRLLLGDTDAARAALSTAIDMDHEYGLGEDAADNERLLSQWSAPAAAPAAANAAEPPSVRSVPLRFAWRPVDAQGRIEITSSYYSEGHFAQITGTKTLRRLVRLVSHDAHAAWRVSQDLTGSASVDARGFNEKNVLFGLAVPVTEALFEHLDFEVSTSGDLLDVLDLGTRALQLSQQARGTIRAGIGQSWSVMQAAALDDELQPLSVGGRAVEAYDLGTGAWIGATLEQGMWYSMGAGLSLPGLTNTALPHDVEFAYTRNVPCTPASAEPACVEIVVHATPNSAALESLTAAMSPLFGDSRYWSTTHVRLVTDPGSLMPYCIDVRRYWHLVGRRYMTHGPESAMQRVVITYNYQPPQPGLAPPGGAPPAK